MQPQVLHMPDELRDALETELCAAVPEVPEIGRKNLPEISETVGNVIAKIMFDDGQDEKIKNFSHVFWDAYLHMQCGTGNPAILLENLPPTRGYLLMYGLAKTEGKPGLVGKLDNDTKDSTAVAPHRDSQYHVLKGQDRKMGQYLYCETAGSNPQSTVFITADEVIDRMAHKRQDIGFEEARAEIIKQLEEITISTGYKAIGPKESQVFPFLSRNPHFDDEQPNAAPEYIVFTQGRTLTDDVEKRSFEDPRFRIDSGSPEIYAQFAHAADEEVEAQSKSAIASTQSNTLAIWNDLLLFHARGKTKDGLDESDRIVHGLESIMDAFDKPHLAVAGPYAKIKLTDAKKHGQIVSQANQRA